MRPGPKLFTLLAKPTEVPIRRAIILSDFRSEVTHEANNDRVFAGRVDSCRACDGKSDGGRHQGVRPVPDTSASGKETTEFKPPLGFTARKRGKLVVYCSTITPVGTRLKSETCYDEPQMREYLIQLEENKSSIDRIRSGCNYTHDCGQTDALAKKTK